MNTLALLLAGYSVVCALSLALTQFGPARPGATAAGRGMGVLVLAALAGLQGAHLAWLGPGWDWVGTGAYRAMLFVVAPAGYGLAQGLLEPQASPRPAQALPVALDARHFAMDFRMTHPLLGQVFRYSGVFEVDVQDDAGAGARAGDSTAP